MSSLISELSLNQSQQSPTQNETQYSPQIQPMQQSVQQQQQQSQITDSVTINNLINGLQTAVTSGSTQLPIRDVPSNSSQITIDPSIQQNYIPPPPLPSQKNENNEIEKMYEDQKQNQKSKIYCWH